MHTRHASLVKAEPGIRAVLARLMAVCMRPTRATHVATTDPDSEEDVDEAFCDDDSATPRVMTVRASRSRAVFRLLAVDLMVRPHTCMLCSVISG